MLSALASFRSGDGLFVEAILFEMIATFSVGGGPVEPDPQKTLEQDLLFAVVKEKYGHLLTEEQMEEVRRAMTGLRDVFRPLRSIRLSNDIEPFAAFKPFRGDANDG